MRKAAGEAAFFDGDRRGGGCVGLSMREADDMPTVRGRYRWRRGMALGNGGRCGCAAVGGVIPVWYNKTNMVKVGRYAGIGD